jgi:pimeloyl-ACP methyl ester carboxylesterase
MAQSAWLAVVAVAALVPAISPAAARPVPQHMQRFPVSDLQRPTRWAPCAFDARDAKDRRAECAFVRMPLDYANPSAGAFRVLVKRLKATVQPSAQVWLLHGGPGASATADLGRLSFSIPDERPDIVYYAVDHRGMGGSERQYCPSDAIAGTGVRERWAGCMAYLRRTVGLARLNQITTSNAARDIGALVEKFRLPGVKVIVNGISYGTSLAHRYMQLYPEQPDGVILSGIEVGSAVIERDGKTYGYGLDWDRRMDAAVAKAFERCALAPECSRRFEKHPWEVARETMRSLYSGHCSELGIDPDRLKETFGAVSFSSSPAALPALVARLRRCNAGDRALLTSVVDRWYPSMSELGSADEARSDAAGNILSASEAFSRQAEDAPALQRQFSEEITVAYGVEKFYALLRDVWPTYPTDEYFGKWPEYRRPLLMLQGGLDTATPLATALQVRAHYQGESQHWVVFPEGNHSLVGHTPTTDGRDCARDIFVRFIDDPRGEIDRSCLARLKPLDWHDREAALADFGVADLWGD